jgi:hypothetical protein
MYITHDDLVNRFRFHPADRPEKAEKHESVRSLLLDAADRLVTITGPPTREQSTAIAKLEEAMFWANAAIARNT